MSRINELLKTIRIFSNAASGVAHWESCDLLGDRHSASIFWSESFLKIDKGVDINGTTAPLFAAYWEVSPNGRLMLKESLGLPAELGSNEAFQYVRQTLEGGLPPTISHMTPTSKGFFP